MFLVRVFSIGAMLLAPAYALAGGVDRAPDQSAVKAETAGELTGEQSEIMAVDQSPVAGEVQQVGDYIYECTAYFEACQPPRAGLCFYTGRDPVRSRAEREALNECKFYNARRGRYCAVETCRRIRRPPPR